MKTITEYIYWLKIFLSPVFFVTLINVILYSVLDSFSNWYLLLYVPGAVAGFLLAERARKKYGTSNYYAKPMNTPDIEETWRGKKNSSV